jgi:predicted nucleic acid-binding protein
VAGRRVAASGTLVLDSEGLSKFAAGESRVLARVKGARARGARVVVSAITLAEVLRGGSRDASVHRVLSRITTVPVTPELGRAAGELLGATSLSGHRCAIDSVVAATALGMARPVMLLTSDANDMSRLVEELDAAKEHRVAVVHV